MLTKIRSAGKNIQLVDGLDQLEKVSAILGTARGIHLMPVQGRTENREYYLAQLKKYRVL